MDSFKKFFIKPWNSTAILSQAPISRFVWIHLMMSYCVLGCSSVVTLFGAYNHMFYEIGGRTTALGFIGSLYWMSKIKPWNAAPRVFIFCLATHFFGLTIGPAINSIVEVDQGYIIKIIMGAVLFYTCQFSAIIHSVDRNIIYEIGEFSTPVFITAWMVISHIYPGFKSYALLLLFQPIPWYLLAFMLQHLRVTLHLRFNFPIHVAWITFLSFCFNYSFFNLMFVYIVVLGFLLHVRMHNQEVLYLAAHTSGENYYASSAVTFYTEFVARTVSLIVLTVGFMMRGIRRYLRPHNTVNDA